VFEDDGSLQLMINDQVKVDQESGMLMNDEELPDYSQEVVYANGLPEYG
jgi:hypothetical protein